MKVVLVLLLLVATATAQPAGIDLDREDAPAGRNELGFDGGAPLVGWGLSLGIGYMARPLVMTKVIEETTYTVVPVARRMTMVLGGALALGGRTVLDVRLPLSRQIGRGLRDFGFGPLDPWVAGDLRLAARIRVSGDNSTGLFARAAMTLPTGNSFAFAGEDASVIGLGIIGRFTAKDSGVVLAAQAGVRLRVLETPIATEVAGNELTGALGMVIPFPRELRGTVEIRGVLGDESGGDMPVRGPSPLEGSVGFGGVAFPGMQMGIRIGAGFNEEIGSPRWRAMFEVAFTGDWQVTSLLPTLGLGHDDDDDDDE